VVKSVTVTERKLPDRLSETAAGRGFRIRVFSQRGAKETRAARRRIRRERETIENSEWIISNPSMFIFAIPI
jgi:hypothetical protein